MNLEQVELAGVRIFFEDMEENIYECFKNKPRERVGTKWFYQQMATSRKNGFSFFKFAEQQMDYFRMNVIESGIRNDDSVELYYQYGLLSEELYQKYKTMHEIK